MAAGKIFAISFAINAIMGGAFSSTMSRSSAAMNRLQERTRQLNAEQKRLDGTWQQSAAAGRTFARTVADLQRQYRAGTLSESQYNAAVAAAAAKMRNGAISAEQYRQALASLRSESAQAAASMRRLQAAQAARIAANAKVSAAWANLTQVGTTAAAFAVPIVNAVETAANFEAAMSKVQAITRASGDDMQRLTADARELGATTQFSATQAAEAMSYLGMAGWNAEQIMSGMPGLLALAAAGGTDLARTADIVSDDLTAFGLSADQAGHMADVFAVTVTRTNTNVEMLGETMKYAAPVAHAFGVSMEETAALAGLMANSGIKATQAGTALRSGFLRLAGPPKMAQKAMSELGMSMSDVTAQQQEARAAMEALGISMEDVNGPRKMSAILTELRNKLQGLSKDEQLATLKAIFGTEAATGWLAVLDAGPETFDKLVSEMENCDGEAENMAKVMQNNAKGAFTQLKSAMESLAISAGSIFLPALTAVMRAGADLAGNIAGWITNHQTLAGVFLSIAAGATTAIASFMAFKTVAAIFSLAAASLREYAIITKETVVAQRLMAVATAAQTRAIVAFNAVANGGTWRKIGQEAAMAYARLRAITWAEIGASMRRGIASGVSSSIEALRRLQIATTASAASTRTGMLSALTAIPGRASAAAQSIMTMVRSITIAGVLQTAANGFRALGAAIMTVSRAGLAFAFSPLGIALIALAGAAYLVYSNWASVGPFFAGLWNQITAAFSAAWTMIQPALASLSEAFAQLWTVLQTTMAPLTTTVMTAFSSIQAALTPLISPLLTLAEIVGGVLLGAFVVFANVAVGAVVFAINTIAAVITGVVGIITGVVNIISGILTGDWSAVWDGFVSIVESAVSIVTGILSGLANAVSGIVSGIMSSIRSAAGAVSSIGSGGDVASNAKGGIYRKGAFLTTFAEEGPEAAIPLDRSARSISLWQEAGRILGMNNSGPSPTLQAAPENAVVTSEAPANGEAPALVQRPQIAPDRSADASETPPAPARQLQPAAGYAETARKMTPNEAPPAPTRQLIGYAETARETPPSEAAPAPVRQLQLAADHAETVREIPHEEQRPQAALGNDADASKTPIDELASIPAPQPQTASVDTANTGSRTADEPAPVPTRDERAYEPALAQRPQVSIENTVVAGKESADEEKPTTAQQLQSAPETVITMPAINMNLNFYGDQKPENIKRAVVDAGRKIQKSFAEQMEAFQRERRRLAYE